MKGANKTLLLLGGGAGLLIYFLVFYNYTAIAWTHKCDQIKWYTTSDEHLILVANSFELKESNIESDLSVVEAIDFFAIDKVTGNLDYYIPNVVDKEPMTRTPNTGIKIQSWVDIENPYILYCRTDQTLKKVNLRTEQNDWKLNIPVEISTRMEENVKTMRLLGKNNDLLYFIMPLDEEGYYGFIQRTTNEYYYNPKVLDKYETFIKHKIEGKIDHLIIEINETTNEIKLLKSIPVGELVHDNFISLIDKPLKNPLNTTLLLKENLELQITGNSLSAKYK